MSELMNFTTRRNSSQRQLLATVSAAAMLAGFCGADIVSAQEDARPTVWIELGGQLSAIKGDQDPFVAPFFTNPAPLPAPSYSLSGVPVDLGIPSPFAAGSPLDAQKPPRYSIEGEGRILFQPKNSDWGLTASIRYGRANADKTALVKRNSVQHYFAAENAKYFGSLSKFFEADAAYKSSHTILDFTAGKDVGIGLLGKRGHSTVNFGVRFAQMTSKTALAVYAVPDLRAYVQTGGYSNKHSFRWQAYEMHVHAERSFHGVGPSLSWDGSVPVLGVEDAAQIDLDFGINGAVLFGKQKASVTESIIGYDRFATSINFVPQHILYAHNPPATIRSRSVTVPNLGGFAGLSFRYDNAKVSFGYRADFFFGAMDAGIDTRRTADMNFHGPFAKISMGLGG